jgi:hypothetical protein
VNLQHHVIREKKLAEKETLVIFYNVIQVSLCRIDFDVFMLIDGFITVRRPSYLEGRPIDDAET